MVGAVAESARLRRRRNGREELPCVQGQGRRLEELPHVRGQVGGREELSHPPKPRGHGREELPHTLTPEARGSGWEDQPRFQGALAVQTQKGLEELSHVEGQEGQWWDTPRPR